jgi:hypothetical protein
MREKIDGAKYRVWYGRRMQIIEPCFSAISYYKGMGGRMGTVGVTWHEK